MIDSVSAIGAQALGGVRSPPSVARPAEGPSFGEALAQVVGSAIDTLKTGEAAAIQGVVGSTPPMKVVESVMAAQRSLESVLAIRDKAVSAYQEIARMAI